VPHVHPDYKRSGIEYGDIVLPVIFVIPSHVPYLRHTSFAHSEISVLCFALDNRASFDAITISWLPIIQAVPLKRPLYLVGTRKDVRGAVENGAENQEDDVRARCVSYEEGIVLASALDAISYTEISIYDDSVPQLIREIVDRSMTTLEFLSIRKVVRKRTRSGCHIL